MDDSPHSHRFYIGCAGWSIPGHYSSLFCPAEDTNDGTPSGKPLTHLERYSRRLSAVEINSSFYRAHRPQTYARWATSVPEAFRFSVKLPRQITHVQRLRASEERLSQFFSEAESLGLKLGPVLVQLPPSLAFEAPIAEAFFEALRARLPFSGSVVCEPRHPSWFAPEAEQMLQQFQIARAAADPAVPVPGAALPGGWGGLIYYRLHGSPRTYYSAYSEEYLKTLAKTLAQRSKDASSPKAIWCIFDNTALGAATANALFLRECLQSQR